MTDTGAITQAIEALEAMDSLMQYMEVKRHKGVTRENAKQALEALKAFKDGVPENLEWARRYDKSLNGGPDMNKSVQAQTINCQAAKHLQEGIK